MDWKDKLPSKTPMSLTSSQNVTAHWLDFWAAIPERDAISIIKHCPEHALTGVFSNCDLYPIVAIGKVIVQPTNTFFIQRKFSDVFDKTIIEIVHRRLSQKDSITLVAPRLQTINRLMKVIGWKYS
jgi:hypothetical protein